MRDMHNSLRERLEIAKNPSEGAPRKKMLSDAGLSRSYLLSVFFFFLLSFFLLLLLSFFLSLFAFFWLFFKYFLLPPFPFKVPGVKNGG